MFSVKGQILNSFSSTGLTASVTTSQLCHCSVKAATDTHKQMSKAGFQWDFAHWPQFADLWAELYRTISFLRKNGSGSHSSSHPQN